MFDKLSMATKDKSGNNLKDYYRIDRKEMVDFVPLGIKQVLEVGCAAGNFGNLLKLNRGAEVWGIEMVASAAQEAQKKLDKVVIGNFENDDLALPLNYFDCVVLNDVLEHFRDPWKELKKISAYLKKDAFIVASIPNIRYFDHMKQLIKHGEWDYKDAGILDRTHLRFFTRKTIEDMFQSCGYNIVSLEGINARKFPWKFRLLNQIFFNKFSDMKFMHFACVAQKQNR